MFQKYVRSKPVSFSYIGVSVPVVAAPHHGTLPSFEVNKQQMSLKHSTNEIELFYCQSQNHNPGTKSRIIEIW